MPEKYEQILKALRICHSKIEEALPCEECPYCDEDECVDKLGADVIRALRNLVHAASETVDMTSYQALVTQAAESRPAIWAEEAIFGIAKSSGALSSIIVNHLVQNEALDRPALEKELGHLIQYAALLSAASGMNIEDAIIENSIRLQTGHPEIAERPIMRAELETQLG